MYRKLSSHVSARNLLLGILLSISPVCLAQQFEHASPPIANPADTRFRDAREDWTTPDVSSSNLTPIKPLVLPLSDYTGYTVELSQMQWRFGDPLDLYVIKPKGIKKPPVIFYLYSYNYDTDYFKNEAWQKAVTKDGFAAVGFVTALTGHRYHDRPMKEWFVSELQECLAVSAHDVQMVLNVLSTRDDLDTSRVGIFAEGSGATIAILASAVDSRIKVLDVVAPWGDWPTWMSTSPFVPDEERADYVKPEFLKKVAPLEPLDWLPKVQAKKVRLQDMTFDTTTPRTAKEKLRAAVPAGTSIVIYNTPEEFNAARNRNQTMTWIRAELRALPEPKAAVTAQSCCKATLPSALSQDR